MRLFRQNNCLQPFSCVLGGASFGVAESASAKFSFSTPSAPPSTYTFKLTRRSKPSLRVELSVRWRKLQEDTITKDQDLFPVVHRAIACYTTGVGQWSELPRRQIANHKAGSIDEVHEHDLL